MTLVDLGIALAVFGIVGFPFIALGIGLAAVLGLAGLFLFGSLYLFRRFRHA